MEKETLRFEDWGKIMSETLTEVKVLRELFEAKIQHMAPKEPPILRKEVMRRLRTTAPTLLKMEREGRITRLRIGKMAYYNFSEVVAAMKKTK